MKSFSEANLVKKTINVHGYDMEERNCADRISGKMDPRTELASKATYTGFLENPNQYSEELQANMRRILGPPEPEKYDKLSYMRYTFGWRSSDLSAGVGKKRFILSAPSGPFAVWQYESSEKTAGCPCVIFIHGGGFVAGDIETVENQCKLIAQKMGGIVFSIDYPLAPEYRYPSCFDACQATVDWVYANAETFGIDNSRIGVAGDSAGGHLALSLALADRNNKQRKINYQCLIYPKVSDSNPGEEYYFWDQNLYDNPENNAIIDIQIRAIGQMTSEIRSWLLPEGSEEYKKDLAPIEAGCEGLCKTLLVTVEYDYLRAECDFYFKMLKDAGVDARAIRYGGLFHGTFDRLGYAPQVEDIIDEIANDMQKL
mgnify:CR=1 FL=1